jgi:phage terminase large subunit
MSKYAHQIVDTAPPKDIVKDPRYKVYQPYGACEDLLYCKEPEVLICGPAGTGKSRAALEKIHICAMKYPGSRHLIVRKTRTSLTQSALVTFDEHVIPESAGVKFRTAEQEYRYRNGSKVVIGGMDKSSKVLSSEYDIIFIQEGTELSLDDFETLTTRNRYAVMPYNQVIADCNPGPPRHWLRQRCNDGITVYLESFHEDNPRLFDHLKNDWTEQGEAYISKLRNLTGVRRKRLYVGEWAAAEGMIYEEEWNQDVHLISRFKIPYTWPRVWVVDFGFKNPFVWQAWAHDEEHDTYYRFAELYMTGLLVEDASRMISRWKRLEHERDPSAILCDWDAEGRGTLERHLGLDTEPATKAILDGIEAVKVRLRQDEEKESQMYFMRDSLIDFDPELADSGLPKSTEEEFESYEWSDHKKKDVPIDKYNHGMDCIRYLCAYAGIDESWGSGMAR